MEVIARVFSQAKGSLNHIRTEMTQELSLPRPNLSPYAPFILSITIPVDRIREVIGKGGEVIQKITKEYSVEIDITEEGVVSVTAKNQDS